MSFTHVARRIGAFATLSLLCSVVVAAPARATDDGSSLFDDGPTSDVGNTGSDSSDKKDPADVPIPGDVLPEDPVGPVGFVDVPTYEAIRVPGELMPSDIKPLNTPENVVLVTFMPEDNSTYRAVLVIEGEDASSEYRFANAVPDGHTAVLQPDGSILFVNREGEHVGGIAAPWAVDAEGNQVPTSFALDGDTVIQTVDHYGAVYPVVADPFWLGVAVVVLIYAPRVSAAATAAYQTCARIQCGPVISTAINNVPTSGSGGGDGSGRPTNTCNARSRRGC